MKITVKKEDCTFAGIAKAKDFAKLLKTEKSITEDMQVLINGIKSAKGFDFNGNNTELKEVQITCKGYVVEFCAIAEIRGYTHKSGNIAEFIAEIKAFGTSDDNGYFSWDMFDIYGVPESFNAKIFIEYF